MELFQLLGKISIDVSGVDEAVSTAKGKLESFGEKVSSVGEKMSSIGTKLTLGVTTPLVGLGAAAIKTTADFESAMSEVAAISGATGDDFIALENKAKEMGKTTKFSASESAEALKYMAMAGWKTSDMLDGLEGIMNLAAASGEDLGTTSDIVTDALTAFGLSASDSGHFADILAVASSNANTNVGMMGETFKYVAPVAGAMGYSAEDTALAIGLMANSGIKASQAGTSLRSIMTRLVSPTKDSQTAMDALGISVTDGSGKMKSLEEIIVDMRGGFAGLTEEEQASYAAMLAGQEAMSGLLAIVNASDADFNKLVTSIGSANGAAKEMADTMNNNLSGQITILKSQLEGLAIQFITLIMPYLKQGVEWLSKLCDWISGLDDNTKKMIITIAAIVAAAGPVLTVGGKIISGVGKIISGVTGVIGIIGKLSPAIGGVISGGGKVIAGIGSLIGKIGGALLPALASIPGPVWIVIGVLAALVAAGVAVYKNWDEIKAWASEKWTAIKDTIGNAVDGIKGFLQGIIDFIGNNWQGLLLLIVNPFAGAFKLLYDNCAEFKNFIDGFLERLKEGLHNFKENTVKKVHELKEGVEEKINELEEKASAGFEKIRQKAGEYFGGMVESVVSKAKEMKENASAQIKEMAEKIPHNFQELKERAAEKFNDLAARWTERFVEAKKKMEAESEEMRVKVNNKLNALKEEASKTAEALVVRISKHFTDMGSDVAKRMIEIQMKGVEGFTSIKEKGSAAVNSLRTNVSKQFAEMGVAIQAKFSEVGLKILNQFMSVQTSLGNIIERVKGFFNFEWKLPDIKLPHFSINGSFSLSPPSIPSIGVEWYAKGGVMNDPTAFGINPQSGNVMVGGEAGAEAIAPIETLKAYVREAVNDNNLQLYNLLNAILMLLRDYLPELANKQLVMDTGVLVGELGAPMYEEFGKIAHNRERRN